MSPETSPERNVKEARERFALQDYYGAVHLLEDVLATGRAFADAHHLLGLCRSLLGQPERALEAFDTAVQLNPKYVEAHIHRGLVLNQLVTDPKHALLGFGITLLGVPAYWFWKKKKGR